MRKYLSLFFFIQSLCSVFDVQAQYASSGLTNGILPNVIPASPEAASLGKYGDWPVSYYTGVPNIGVPLYKISTGEFELPITLSYHSGGIKVDEVASWVGAGFSLQAGGVISRTIVGFRDEDEKRAGGFLYRNLTNRKLQYAYDLSDRDNYVFFDQVVKEQIDTEPDMFFFNFAGFSGKFYFDEDGQFRSMPANSLKLVQSPINNKSGSVMVNVPWKIIDEKGNIYVFGQSYHFGEELTNGCEATQVVKTPVSIDARVAEPEPSAWYLTHIIPVSGKDTISFEYDRKNEMYTLPQQQSYRYINNFNAYGGYNIDANIHQKILYNGYEMKGFANQLLLTNGKSMLKKIKWSNGELHFTAGLDRQDMTGKQLQAIALYNTKGQLQRTVNFNYSYINQRYYLNLLSENDASNVSIGSYKFVYYSPELLPARNTSNAQDHWGYYNGNASTSLLPWNDAFISDQAAQSSLSANREPNNDVCYYGTLKSVVFPTGGSSVFNFESNTYSGSSPVNGGSPPAKLVDARAAANTEGIRPYIKKTTFTVPFRHKVYLTSYFTNYSRVMSRSMTWSPSVRIQYGTVSSGQQIYYADAYGCFGSNGTLNYGVSMQNNSDGTVNLINKQEFMLDAGTYTMTVDIADCMFLDDPMMECGTLPYVEGSLMYKKYEILPDGEVVPPLAGGLRVKKISSFEGNGTLINSKSFQYSNGNLLVYPKYLKQYQIDLYPFAAPNSPYPNSGIPQHCLMLEGDIREVTSSSQSILGFTQGAPVGYTKVRELELDGLGNEKGATDYYYSYAVDSLSQVQGRPNWTGYYGSFDIMNADFPRTNFDFKSGNLLIKAVYAKNSDKFIIVDSTYYNYAFNEYDKGRRYNRLRGLHVMALKQYLYKCGTSYNGYIIPHVDFYKNNFAYGYYDLISSWPVITEVQNFRFDNNGANPVMSKTKFYYDNPTHMQLSREERFLSNGAKETLFTLYPEDYLDDNSFISDLKSNHLLQYPIERVKVQEVGVLKSVVSASLFTYQRGARGVFKENYLWSTSGVVSLANFKFSNQEIGQLPSIGSKKFFNRDSRYYLNAEVKLIDGYSNPREVVQQAKTTVFLWGYNGQYPVAKIENATYTEIQNILTNIEINNLNAASVSEGTVRTVIAKLRNHANMRKAQVSTYTYKPLIGMTSMTDPRGITEYYEYDGFQRLKDVLDFENNVLKDYRYNFRP